LANVLGVVKVTERMIGPKTVVLDCTVLMVTPVTPPQLADENSFWLVAGV